MGSVAWPLKTHAAGHGRRGKGQRVHLLPGHRTRGRVERVQGCGEVGRVPGLAEADVAKRGRAVGTLPVIGRRRDEAAGDAAEHDVRHPDEAAGGRIEPVVRAVLAAHAEERAAVRRGAEVGRGTESQSHDGSPCSIRGGVNTHAGVPLLIRSAMTRSLYGPRALKSQSATSKTTRPRVVSRVGDDQTATAPKVAAVLDGIHQRSPKARVFVVGYLAILPESGPGCWPQMPIAPDDVPYLRDTEKKLNAMLAAQAGANGAKYVDAYAASIDHDACQLPGFRWVEPAVPTTPAAPVHPNLFGMQGYSAAVLARINERG
jgi:GDSL-like Lipase/Acylhydrolase family